MKALKAQMPSAHSLMQVVILAKRVL